MKSHHLLIAGLLLFLTGVQFRMVESFTLSEPSSHFVSAQLGAGPQPQTAAWGNAPGRKVVEPPRWLGLAGHAYARHRCRPAARTMNTIRFNRHDCNKVV